MECQWYALHATSEALCLLGPHKGVKLRGRCANSYLAHCIIVHNKNARDIGLSPNPLCPVFICRGSPLPPAPSIDSTHAGGPSVKYLYGHNCFSMNGRSLKQRSISE